MIKSTHKNIIWVRPMSFYNSCCFGSDSFQYELFCQKWEEVSLVAVKPKIASKLSCTESWIEAGDYVTAFYAREKKVYVGEVVENYEDDFRVSFLWHVRVLPESLIFRKPKKVKYCLGRSKHILCVTPQPTLHKKWSFPLRIFPVNVARSAGNCGFGHVYWRNPEWKTSFLSSAMDMKRGLLILERNTLGNIVLLFGQWSK